MTLDQKLQVVANASPPNNRIEVLSASVIDAFFNNETTFEEMNEISKKIAGIDSNELMNNIIQIAKHIPSHDMDVPKEFSCH